MESLDAKLGRNDYSDDRVLASCTLEIRGSQGTTWRNLLAAAAAASVRRQGKITTRKQLERSKVAEIRDDIMGMVPDKFFESAQLHLY